MSCADTSSSRPTPFRCRYRMTQPALRRRHSALLTGSATVPGDDSERSEGEPDLEPQRLASAGCWGRICRRTPTDAGGRPGLDPIDVHRVRVRLARPAVEADLVTQSGSGTVRGGGDGRTGGSLFGSVDPPPHGSRARRWAECDPDQGVVPPVVAKRDAVSSRLWCSVGLVEQDLRSVTFASDRLEDQRGNLACITPQRMPR